MRWLLCALLQLAVLRVDASKGHSLTKAQWQPPNEGLRDPSADDLLAEDDEDDKDLQDAECLKMRVRNREDAERLMGLERKMAEQETDLARLSRAVRELRSLAP
mmetsp:Transcript_54312/g.86395  ORF Transcript_54312/g.86395 Transcript_54312/m.86395 type:complete len:104 (+) Transcript_54312:85-396(+)